MKRLLFYCGMILSLFSFPLLASAEMVSGIVYDDKNKNSNLDGNERGIKDVAVSNGSAVILTDKKGRYRIELNKGETLFISKPAGYSLPLNENNLPRFYFNHAPEGTPDDIRLRHPGLAPSAQIKGDLNFPLYRREEPRNYDVILLSDPQTGTNEELDYFRDKIVTELLDGEAAFGITTGDIMNDDLSLFPRYAAIVARVGVPWFNVPGNHDINYLAPDDSHALDTYRKHFGPSYYSFNWGKAHFIIMDDIHYKGTDPDKRLGAGGYIVSLDEKQLTWLKADLSFVPKDRLVVLAMHAPIKAAGMNMPEFDLVDRHELLGLLSGFDNIISIAGHLHATQHLYFDSDDGYTGKNPLHHHTITTASGSWWSGVKDISGIPHSFQADGTPNGYHIMSVKGNKCTLRYKAAGLPDDCQMRIMLEKQPEKELISNVALSEINNMKIVVNLFDGGEKSTVSAKINENEYYHLDHVLRNDTFTYNSYQNVESFISGRKIDSTHIWSGSLNAKIKPGIHTITVKATDEYGREHIGRKIFEVTSD